jgi:hypothetical protein
MRSHVESSLHVPGCWAIALTGPCFVYGYCSQHEARCLPLPHTHLQVCPAPPPSRTCARRDASLSGLVAAGATRRKAIWPDEMAHAVCQCIGQEPFGSGFCYTGCCPKEHQLCLAVSCCGGACKAGLVLTRLDYRRASRECGSKEPANYATGGRQLLGPEHKGIEGTRCNDEKSCRETSALNQACRQRERNFKALLTKSFVCAQVTRMNNG